MLTWMTWNPRLKFLKETVALVPGLGWAGLGWAGLELAKCMNAKLFPISHRAETRDCIRTRHGRRSLCVRTRAAPPIAAEMATATPISIIIVWDKDLFWDLKKWAYRMIMWQCRLWKGYKCRLGTTCPAQCHPHLVSGGMICRMIHPLIILH